MVQRLHYVCDCLSAHAKKKTCSARHRTIRVHDNFFETYARPGFAIDAATAVAVVADLVGQILNNDANMIQTAVQFIKLAIDCD